VASTPMDPPVIRAWRRLGRRMFDQAMEDNLRRIANLVRGTGRSGARILDLGCWDGSTTFRYAPPEARLFGVELDGIASTEALGRGIRVTRADLNGSLPFRSGTFDAVTSNQVIEHLCNTDMFLSEARRVLRPGGILVASTENLSSWHNIVALLLGWQAFSLTNVSDRTSGVGNPFANLRGEEPGEKGWQHLRIFSYRGLEELVRAHGFRPVRVFGAGYYPLPSSVGMADPRHAVFITAMGRRPV
jgi:SAM-dependent methyltransferase